MTSQRITGNLTAYSKSLLMIIIKNIGITSLLRGEYTGNRWIPLTKANIVESFSKSWRHHTIRSYFPYREVIINGCCCYIIVAPKALSEKGLPHSPTRYTYGLGCDHHVKRNRKCTVLVNIIHPKFGAGELPFHIIVTLRIRYRDYWLNYLLVLGKVLDTFRIWLIIIS